jgi:hypothetical protein
VKELDREEEEEEPYLLKISASIQTGTAAGWIASPSKIIMPQTALHCWMDRFPIKDHNALSFLKDI